MLGGGRRAGRDFWGPAFPARRLGPLGTTGSPCERMCSVTVGRRGDRRDGHGGNDKGRPAFGGPPFAMSTRVVNRRRLGRDDLTEAMLGDNRIE